MIPLKSENPTKNFPVFTLLFLTLNIIIFIYGINLPINPSVLYENYALIPYELVHHPVKTYPTLYTSMFLHAGIGHLGGNMLYLWIFGNNIEDVLGKFRFILFYFICGTIAALGHIATDMDSQIPMIGASGAISGILGAYLMLFPFARIKTFIFLGIFWTIARIPSIVLLIIWIVLQILNSLATDSGGTAWFAHIGGFISGVLLILPFKHIR
ncbi:MAG: rhomboid family intramembrane serine protease [Nitrospina sp.]|nr:rhomboid family intramembrane serine protease [Nitrospina sp.]|tara:strand:+ start:729 stop:1364 length:636 start_codon:yes stop_codon:yes gene_type:complete